MSGQWGLVRDYNDRTEARLNVLESHIPLQNHRLDELKAGQNLNRSYIEAQFKEIKTFLLILTLIVTIVVLVIVAFAAYVLATDNVRDVEDLIYPPMFALLTWLGIW